MMSVRKILPILLAVCALSAACGEESSANTWTKVTEDQLGPGFSPGLVWSPELKRFVYFCGSVSHQFTGQRPYDVMSFDPASRSWRNDLPKGAEDRGPETGNVKDVEFKTPYFGMSDGAGLVRPNRRHTYMWYHYAFAPWDGKMYALFCGRTVTYDPKAREWKDLKPAAAPMPEVGSGRQSLSWSALCADPVNREIVLFGGCGLSTPDGSPGTWVYSTEKNEWRKLDLKTEPPPRALAPMVFDPATKKIVLFGGDRLDQLYADTWVYDCATRTWEERKPELSPSPRFGHALLRLPKSGAIVLLGGKAYSSSTAYCAVLYKPLPFEAWTYDVAKNQWSLIQRLESGGPKQNPIEATAAAAGDDDSVLMIASGEEKGSTHSAWLCRFDPKADESATAKFGVKPGTLEFRTGSYDPEWYTKDVPAADPAAAADVLKNIPNNQWVALKCPRWPDNRQGGGWSTVSLDTDRDQLLHISGGHSSYFGNDMAHYDIATGRWSIACRPQFALEFNYDLNGPGMWGFNGAPWGNHNYRAYAYDQKIQRVVYIKGQMTLYYDPVTRTWPHAEKSGDLPFHCSKYINYLCSTPQGVACWTQTKESQSKAGLWRLEDRKWKAVSATGEPLPFPVCDGSTVTHDSKRDRLLITTTAAKNSPHGQIWSADLKSGEVKKLNPAGWESITGARFAREAVYLPKDDLLLFGFLMSIDGKLQVPVYDCAGNRWLSAAMPGAEFMNAGKPGSSVDLGLVYDAKRELIWATLTSLKKEGALRVCRVDAASLGAVPLK
jgi:hypothetical protein